MFFLLLVFENSPFPPLLLMCFYGHFKVVTVLSVEHRQVGNKMGISKEIPQDQNTLQGVNSNTRY